MLIMFRVKNFASFKDDVILDLRKTSYKQYMDHVFDYGEYSLLKTVAIFGANASGKSNLISALASFSSFILRQFFDKDDNSYVNTKKITPMKPFLLSKDLDNEIEFEIVFGHNGSIYQYGYSIIEDKVTSEWLLINDEEVFEREKNSNEIIFGDKYKDLLKDYTKFRDDRLYISNLDYFATEPEIKAIIDDFKEYFREKFNIYFELILEFSIKGNPAIIGIHKELEEDEALRKKVAEYVRKIDVGIKDIVIEKENYKNGNTGEIEEISVLKTVHSVYDDDGNEIGEKTFGLELESTGTIRFISFIQEILQMMNSGGVFIVDELSSRLHPLVTKFIIDIFHSKLNKENAQLIFTTHDVSIMNKETFRRDQVAFVDKNEKGESTLYTLADLGVKQDATFDKDYFKGKYGAIPIVQSFLDKGSVE